MRGRIPTIGRPKCQSEPQAPLYPAILEFLIIDKAFQTLTRFFQEADNGRSRGQRNLVERKGLYWGRGVADALHGSAYHGFEYGIYR